MQRHRQREKQAPCREPDAGLDFRTLGSHPELKADAHPLSHLGVPGFYVFIERDSDRAQAGGAAEAKGEADSSLSREPDVGLDPRTLRSWPEQKADVSPPEPPRHNVVWNRGLSSPATRVTLAAR